MNAQPLTLKVKHADDLALQLAMNRINATATALHTSRMVPRLTPSAVTVPVGNPLGARSKLRVQMRQRPRSYWGVRAGRMAHTTEV